MGWKQFNFKGVFMLMTQDSIGHLKTLDAWAFYCRAIAWSLNGNAAAHCSALKKRLSWIHTRTQAFFYRFVACAFPFFEVKSILSIDRYQNAISKAISQHELNKVQLQERYTLVTQDSIGHLKTLCISVLSLVVALESEWKRYSSWQSDKKKASVQVWIQL